jgi:transposase
MEVVSGAPVTEVARRYGVSRQAVQGWLGHYESDGLAGLADHSHRPRYQPRQLDAEIEALICQLRGAHPRWVRGGCCMSWARRVEPAAVALDHLPGAGAPWPGPSA